MRRLARHNLIYREGVERPASVGRVWLRSPEFPFAGALPEFRVPGRSRLRPIGG
jgi:hypothetical protein